jgi:type II secretory pathway pseudopilin PulG
MPAMTATLRDTAGMTVVEVIIALGVITVGLLALIAAMPLSTSVIAESNLKTTAAFLAQQGLEQIKNANWSATPPDTLGGAGSNGTAAVSVAGFPDRWPDKAYGTIASYPGFRREVRIADCSVISCSGIAVGTVSIDTMRQVTVTVFFRPFRPMAGTAMVQEAEESVQFVTLIVKR